MTPLLNIKERALARFSMFFTCIVGVQLAMANQHIEEVFVEGRRGDLLGIARSASEGTISQLDLALRPIQRPGDILEAIPGLIVTQHSGSGKSNQMFLRGFNLDHGTDFATLSDSRGDCKPALCEGPVPRLTRRFFIGGWRAH